MADDHPFWNSKSRDILATAWPIAIKFDKLTDIDLLHLQWSLSFAFLRLRQIYDKVDDLKMIFRCFKNRAACSQNDAN